MNKKLKELIIALLIIIVAVSAFLTVDCSRLKNNKKPIFSIKYAQYLDGGTTTYYGLFYKIIDYNKLEGYNGVKVGTWFLGYDNSL